MQRLMEMVHEFMTAAGQRIGKEPGDVTEHNAELGLSLIAEEHNELVNACCQEGEESLVDIADALGDLLYVTTWTALAFGFPMVEIMEEIQRANMAKFGPGSTKREDGKQLKPPDWKPPNIEQFIFPERFEQ